MRKNKSWCVGTLLIVAAFLLSSCGTFPNRPEEPMHTYVPGTVTLSNDTWEDTRNHFELGIGLGRGARS